MDTILASSGYYPQTMQALRRHWNVVDIADPREALGWLEESANLPLALAIGYVRPREQEETWRPQDARPMPARVMLQAAHRIDPDLPVVISTGERRSALIVEYVKLGAFDYVVEPHPRDDPEDVARYTNDLVLALQRATQWRATVLENRRLRQRLSDEDEGQPLLTRSPRMRRLLDLAHRVAETPATVLVTGESGTGKELIARRVHALSGSAREPFVAINCGALSETLLNSELFGHVRGAFTGADRSKAGLIREAGAGTLFLDEISAVSRGFQTLLLRVLEERRARPVGGGEEYRVRCRFVAAANRDLADMVRKGEFREDLFYRLNVFPLELPPLRKRAEDIPILAQHFLHQAARSFRRNVGGFDPEAMRRLEQADWPGNVRQLRNAVERAVILCSGSQIGVAEIGEVATHGAGPGEAMDDGASDYRGAMRRHERRLLRQALRACGGNVTRAAARLGMKRTTLAYRLRRVGADDEA